MLESLTIYILVDLQQKEHKLSILKYLNIIKS